MFSMFGGKRKRGSGSSLSSKEKEDVRVKLLATTFIKTFIVLSFSLYLFLAVLVGSDISLQFSDKACIENSGLTQVNLKENSP